MPDGTPATSDATDRWPSKRGVIFTTGTFEELANGESPAHEVIGDEQKKEAATEAKYRAEHPQEDKKTRRKRLISWCIADWVMFTLSLQFSVYFASLWPYLSQIDAKADEDFFGWVVASYCLGQILGSPVLGFWSNRRREVRVPCMTSLMITVCGNALMISAESFHRRRRFVVLSARFIMGCASGINGSLRAFIATSSPPETRSRAIATATAFMTLGLIAGPGLQAMVTFIGYPGIRVGILFLNMYTVPSLILMIAFLCSIVLLATSFYEYSEDRKFEETKRRFDVIPSFNPYAVTIMCFCWFCTFFTITNMETLSSPYAMIIFNWNREQATLYASILIGVSSVFSILTYGFYIWRGSKIENRKSIIFGISMQLLYFLLTFPYPAWKTNIHYFKETANVTQTSAASFDTAASNVTGTWEVGCEQGFDWCLKTVAIPQPIYLLGGPALFIGMPAVNVALSTLYSGILGPRPQALMQSVLIMCGSAARLVGPVITMYLFTNFGPMVVWSVNMFILLSAVGVILTRYRILVPLILRPSLKSGQSFNFNGGMVFRF